VEFLKKRSSADSKKEKKKAVATVLSKKIRKLGNEKRGNQIIDAYVRMHFARHHLQRKGMEVRFLPQKYVVSI
jgi:hypothetical protein